MNIKKKNEIKKGKVSLPLKNCSACARVWSNCMQHSCSTSVHTSIQYEHVMRASIHMHPPKAPSPKKCSWHACLRTQTHMHPTIRLFALKIIKKIYTWYICTQSHKHLKKKKKKKKRKKENCSFPQKKIRGRHSCAGTHPCVHSRPQHHKYPNTLIDFDRNIFSTRK